jgi:hypothetical protein
MKNHNGDDEYTLYAPCSQVRRLAPISEFEAEAERLALIRDHAEACNALEAVAATGCWFVIPDGRQVLESPAPFRGFTRQVKVLDDGEYIDIRHHIWGLAFGVLPLGFLVRPGCGFPGCCNPGHLGLLPNHQARALDFSLWNRAKNRRHGAKLGVAA